MLRLSSVLLVVLVCAASALAAPPDARHSVPTEALFPIYTDRSQNPTVWDGIAEALRKAGLPNAIDSIRVRWTAVWSVHVVLKPTEGQPPLRAVVSFDVNTWKVLCFTSEAQGCSKYQP